MVVRGKTLVQKTLFLSASHFVVRSIGFLLRLWLSRELGAQAMGLVELAQSAQMLLITPVVTGLPAAVSRLCAKAEGKERARVVRCALLLARRLGQVLRIPVETPLSVRPGTRPQRAVPKLTKAPYETDRRKNRNQS